MNIYKFKYFNGNEYVWGKGFRFEDLKTIAQHTPEVKQIIADNPDQLIVWERKLIT